MNTFKATMAQAMAGMGVQTRRIELSAENISNADTPGYRRKLLVADLPQTSGERFRSERIMLDETPGERLYDPSNPMSDGQGYVTMSNVSLVTEMADMREANRTYEANLNAFQQARTMYRSVLDVLKR